MVHRPEDISSELRECTEHREKMRKFIQSEIFASISHERVLINGMQSQKAVFQHFVIWYRQHGSRLHRSSPQPLRLLVPEGNVRGNIYPNQ